jgi:hypothetical protein
LSGRITTAGDHDERLAPDDRPLSTTPAPGGRQRPLLISKIRTIYIRTLVGTDEGAVAFGRVADRRVVWK